MAQKHLPEGHFVEVRESVRHRVFIPAESEQAALDEAIRRAWKGEMPATVCKRISASILTFSGGVEPPQE